MAEPLRYNLYKFGELIQQNNSEQILAITTTIEGDNDGPEFFFFTSFDQIIEYLNKSYLNGHIIWKEEFGERYTKEVPYVEFKDATMSLDIIVYKYEGIGFTLFKPEIYQQLKTYLTKNAYTFDDVYNH